MQTKDYSITLDMMRTLPFRPFEVVEGDTGNLLHVTLLNNGEAMDLAGCRINIAFASSIGFSMQDETSGIVKTESPGTFDVALLPAAYGAGNVSADVQVYSGENNETLVTSTRFDFRCRKSLISGDIIRANAAYPPLIEAARVANEAAASALAAAARIDTDIGELNVQANWDETDEMQDSFIRNKPIVPVVEGNVGAPLTHAAQHGPGGSDPVTPIAHAARHAAGGADALTPGDIGAAKLTNGCIDAEQSAVEISAKTAGYTVAAEDNGKDIWITSASAATLTIPTQAAAGFSEKTYFFVTRGGAGSLAIAGASGVTVNASGGRLNLAEQYGTVLVRKTASDAWLVTGNLSS
ncbi:MAG: BppU family phage baseplate upper protein [Clostridiales bacterium]|nr:BppU family phage baseplate upper protein [Clostridiales bacterium]